MPERHHLRGSGIACTQNASAGARDRAAGQEHWPSTGLLALRRQARGQVIEQPGKNAGPAQQAVLACTLAHPNVVRGYRYASRPKPRSADTASGKSLTTDCQLYRRSADTASDKSLMTDCQLYRRSADTVSGKSLMTYCQLYRRSARSTDGQLLWTRPRGCSFPAPCTVRSVGIASFSMPSMPFAPSLALPAMPRAESPLHVSCLLCHLSTACQLMPQSSVLLFSCTLESHRPCHVWCPIRQAQTHTEKEANARFQPVPSLLPGSLWISSSWPWYPERPTSMLASTFESQSKTAHQKKKKNNLCKLRPTHGMPSVWRCLCRIGGPERDLAGPGAL